MKDIAKSTAHATPGRDIVGSLERGLTVIEILANHADGLTLTEVAEKASLTRAGARRFLLTLVASGYAAQDGRRFLLTPKLLSQARTWLEGVSLWDYAAPFMRSLAADLNESCSAAILADTDVVYVARVPGERIISIALHVGTRLPAYCTAMGRVLLAGLPVEQRSAILARSNLVRNTQATETDPQRLLEIISKVAADGYSLVDRELEPDLRALAVPIRDREGRIVAALNVPTQAARHAREEILRDMLPRLRQAADSIENYFVVQ